MRDVLVIMGKLDGVELGKLFLRDTIGIFSGIKRVYSENDFDIAVRKQERTKQVKFFQYVHFSECISLRVYCYWIAIDGINELLHKLDGFQSVIVFTKFSDSISKVLTCDRLIHNFGDVPGDIEKLLRDKSTELCDKLLETKEAIAKIYSNLKEYLILYFSCRDLLQGLSDKLSLPELGAVLSDDTLSNIEAINSWIDGLEMPYRELFQKVDIGLTELKLR